MQHIQRLVFLFVFVFVFLANYAQNNLPTILVFSKTTGFRHGSIPAGKAANQNMGVGNNFIVDTTERSDAFNDDSLKKYSAVVFLNTTGDVLDSIQQSAFEKYVQGGAVWLLSAVWPLGAA